MSAAAAHSAGTADCAADRNAAQDGAADTTQNERVSLVSTTTMAPSFARWAGGNLDGLAPQRRREGRDRPRHTHTHLRGGRRGQRRGELRDVRHDEALALGCEERRLGEVAPVQRPLAVENLVRLAIARDLFAPRRLGRRLGLGRAHRRGLGVDAPSLAAGGALLPCGREQQQLRLEVRAWPLLGEIKGVCDTPSINHLQLRLVVCMILTRRG